MTSFRVSVSILFFHSSFANLHPTTLTSTEYLYCSECATSTLFIARICSITITATMTDIQRCAKTQSTFSMDGWVSVTVCRLCGQKNGDCHQCDMNELCAFILFQISHLIRDSELQPCFLFHMTMSEEATKMKNNNDQVASIHARRQSYNNSVTKA